MADDVALSALVVEMRLNMSRFEEGLAQVDKLTQKTADSVDRSFSSLTEGRGGLMLVEESLGVHLPRHLNTLIAEIPGVGAAFAAMLPIAGIAVAIEIIGKLIEHHHALQEAAEKLKTAEEGVGLTTASVFNGLNEKLLEAGIKADELRGKHFAALKKELQLIDMQSMEQLEGTFSKLAKSADAVFALLKVSWYQFGSGSEGAKASLEKFQAQYDKLLATKDKTGAADLLDKKVKREEEILALQKQAADSQNVMGVHQGNYAKYEEAIVKLRQLGVGITKNEIEAEQTLLDILHAQQTAAVKVGELNKANKDNKKDETTIKVGGEENKLADATINGDKQIEDADAHMWEAKALLALSGQKKTAEIEDAITAIHLEATKRQYSNDMIAAVARLNVLQNAFVKDKAAIKASEDAIIAMGTDFETKQTNEQTAGNNRRFAVQEEADRQRIALTQRMGEETFRFEQEYAKLALAADDEAASHRLKMHQSTDQQLIAEDRRAENAQYLALVEAWQKESAFLDPKDKEFLAKQQALDHKMEEEAQKHQTKMTQITDKGEEERMKKVITAEEMMTKAIADNAARSIVTGKGLADSMKKLGEQMLTDALSHMIQHLLMAETYKIKEDLISAKLAASKTFSWVMQDVPPPASFVLAPIAAAAAFAGVMAFDQGGIVPSDSMAQVHKNEMILPPAISQGLQTMISRGNRGGNSTVNMNIHARDANSFKMSQHQIQADMNRSINIAGRRNN